MKALVLSCTLVLTALAAYGCSGDRPNPTEMTGLQAAFGKQPSGGGATKTDTDSRALIVFSDAPHGVAPGVEGDSRSKDGSTNGTPDEYQGSYCGVFAKLFTGAGGSGNLDADFGANYTSTMSSSCGSARSLTFHLGGALGDVVYAPHFVVQGLALLAVNESRPQAVGFGIQQPNCQRVRFDSQYSGVTDGRITRLDDGSTGVRQWRVESQEPHKAQCLAMRKNGTLYPAGDPIVLPFSYTVTEVPYPYPTYPSGS